MHTEDIETEVLCVNKHTIKLKISCNADTFGAVVSYSYSLVIINNLLLVAFSYWTKPIL